MVQPDGTEQGSGLLVEEIARGRQGRPKINYNAMGRHRKARNIRVLADAALDEERVDLKSLASWSVIDDCA